MKKAWIRLGWIRDRRRRDALRMVLGADTFVLSAVSEEGTGRPARWEAVAVYLPGDAAVQIALADAAVALCDSLVLGELDSLTAGAITGPVLLPPVEAV